MSTEIVPFPFEGVEVRVIVDNDGSPWFVANDVAQVLDLGNPRSSLALLDEDEKGVHTVDTLGGHQATATVNEPGLYSLILRSRKPEAKAFKRWVTHEVLPEIRRTGAYGQPADDLALPQTYLEALEALISRERANVELATENAHLAPRATAWDAIVSAEGDYSVGQAAKMLAHAGIPNMGPTRLFQRLADIGWTYRAPDRSWAPYAGRVEKGFLSLKPQFHYHPGTGEKVIDAPQLRVTLKGVEQLRLRLAETRHDAFLAAEDRYKKAESRLAVMVPEAAALAGCIRALDALPQTRRNTSYSGMIDDQTDRPTVERILRSLASKYGINLIEREVAPCDRAHLDDASPALIADAFARMVRS